ncbi:hypothetical protein [Clostridium ganghwense]|uniref:Uncharacterized protein n=1 Tax=Clostridium ganghwense TaxID=312089 RepID=A0ABT4CRZ5_9CLOT|nr:hypothetical protein [Clostridium ganghwense]MCY6371839.1 hypothetical protein [Clostridium ganghwense]
MLDNIFETIVVGSNTEFLDIPEKDFFLNYDKVDEESAQDLADKYFAMREKEGIPHAKDIKMDNSTHRVKITVEVHKNRKEKSENFL